MRSGYLTASIIGAALLFWGLADHAYGYYVLMRWIVCGVSVVGVYLFIGRGQPGWVAALAIIAIVVNPIVPVHMRRTTWAVLDVVAGLTLLASGLTASRWRPPKRDA